MKSLIAASLLFASSHAFAGIESCESVIAAHMKTKSIEVTNLKKLPETYNFADLYEAKVAVDDNVNHYLLIITTPDWMNRSNDCEIKAVEVVSMFSES